MTNENWKNIHPDFANKSYQEQWEENFTYEQTQNLVELGFKPSDCWTVGNWKNQSFTTIEVLEWVKAGFQPGEYYDAKQWKSLKFTSQQAKKWKDRGFTYEEARNWIGSNLKPDEVDFAAYLRDNKLSVNDSSRSQYWLTVCYPLESRSEVSFLDISNQNLKGNLKVEGFSNLRIFICSNNKINILEFDRQSLTNLTRLDCSFNQICRISGENTYSSYSGYNNYNSYPQEALNLEKFIANDNCFQYFPQFHYSSYGYGRNKSGKLVHFDMRNNPLSSTNLENFTCFPNLEVIMIGSDEKTISSGLSSFKPLKKLTNLKKLYINNLSTTADLEYLPENLEKFAFKGCLQIEGKLKNYDNSLKNWRENQDYYKLYQESKQELEEKQKEIISLQDKLGTKEKDELDLRQKLEAKQEELKQLQIKNSSYQQFVENLLENKKNSLEELVRQAKEKLGESQEWLETFLQIQEELTKNPDNTFVRDQEAKTQNILNKKLTEEEIKNLFARQKEILELSQQLTDFNLLQHTQDTEQVAQVVQLPSRS